MVACAEGCELGIGYWTHDHSVLVLPGAGENCSFPPKMDDPLHSKSSSSGYAFSNTGSNGFNLLRRLRAVQLLVMMQAPRKRQPVATASRMMTGVASLFCKRALCGVDVSSALAVGRSSVGGLGIDTLESMADMDELEITDNKGGRGENVGDGTLE